ncbi:uncharacterized protein LOC144144723 [Haemaphysalis longicornis]
MMASSGGLDSPRSWVVLAFLSWCMMMCTVSVRAAGVIYVGLVEHFRTSREEASLPITLHMSVLCCTSSTETGDTPDVEALSIRHTVRVVLTGRLATLCAATSQESAFSVGGAHRFFARAVTCPPPLPLGGPVTCPVTHIPGTPFPVRVSPAYARPS